MDKPAFHSVKKGSIKEAVEALKQVFGLTSGSIAGLPGSDSRYDFYSLLDTYMNDPEARVEIHRIMEASGKRSRHASEVKIPMN